MVKTEELAIGSIDQLTPGQRVRRGCGVMRGDLRAGLGHVGSGLEIRLVRLTCMGKGLLGECIQEAQAREVLGVHE